MVTKNNQASRFKQTIRMPSSSGIRPVPVKPTPTVASGALLKGGKLLVIEHGESRYRLQLTRSQKLILTKE